MSFTNITKEGLLKAAVEIEEVGISVNKIFSNYWVVMPNGREYPFNELVRTYWRLAGLTPVSFISNEYNRNLINQLGFDFKYYKENIGFFQEHEIEAYKNVAGKPYRKANLQNQLSGNKLKKVVKQVNKWAELSSIPGFTHIKDSKWQWSGTFKSYIWIKIRRPDADPRLFIVIGCDGVNGSLYMQLNCQRSNPSQGTTKPLPAHIIDQVDRYLAMSNYREVSIPFDQLHYYNWNSLISKTKDFFLQQNHTMTISLTFCQQIKIYPFRVMLHLLQLMKFHHLLK